MKELVRDFNSAKRFLYHKSLRSITSASPAVTSLRSNLTLAPLEFDTSLDNFGFASGDLALLELATRFAR